MEELKKRIIDKHMTTITTPLASGVPRDMYTLLAHHKEAAIMLFDLAFSAGYRQRDADKILETVKEEKK